MGSWVEEKPTMHLRFVGRRMKDGEFTYVERRLQQLWKIAKGGLGRVEYSEEWRDVPEISEEVASDGR